MIVSKCYRTWIVLLQVFHDKDLIQEVLNVIKKTKQHIYGFIVNSIAMIVCSD